MLAVERARRADTNPGEILALRARLGDRFGDHRLYHAGDAIDDGVCTLFGASRLGAHRQLAAPVLGHCAGDDVRAAKVDTDDVALSFSGRHMRARKRERTLNSSA